MSLRTSIVIAALAGVAACSDSSAPQPIPTDPSLAADVQPIFNANCALSGCHAGSAPALGQNLSEGMAWSNIVNVPSVELPSMNRVTAGDAENSYLVHKVQGTHTDVGGSGARMPLGRAALSQQDIQKIRNWIQSGAPNN